MLSDKRIQITKEAAAIIKNMEKEEYEKFLDFASSIASLEQNQFPKRPVDEIIGKVFSAEATRWADRREEASEKARLREAIKEDIQERRNSLGQFVPRQTTTPSTEEDASTLLDRIARQKMIIDPSLDYSTALSRAQAENRGYAERIAAELDEFRRDHKTRAGF